MNSTIVKTEINNPAPSLPSSVVPPVNAEVNPANRRRKVLVVAGAVLAVGIVLAAGIVPRLRAQDKLAQAARETDRVSVVVTNVTRSTGSPVLNLPATVRAFEE